jgi:CHAD domain-containing protein
LLLSPQNSPVEPPQTAFVDLLTAWISVADAHQSETQGMTIAEATPSIRDQWHDALVSDLVVSASLLCSDELSLQKRIKLARSRLKRSQAMLRLAPASIRAGCKKLERQLHFGRRDLGEARDAQAVLEALDDLRPGRSPKRRSADRKLIQDWRCWLALNQARTLRALSGEDIVRETAGLRMTAKSLAKRLLRSASDQEVVELFRSDCRRARKRMPGAHAAQHPQELHRFRQAVIDHRYQLEFLLPVASQRIMALEKLRRRLGAFQDLEMLKYAVDARENGPDPDRLQRLVRRRQRKRLNGAMRLARQLFDGRAKNIWPHDPMFYGAASNPSVGLKR